MWRASEIFGVLVLGTLVGGCGDGFAPPSEVHGLRVLAVRPDPASGSPGATVGLDLLIADSRPFQADASGVLAPPPLDVRWLAGCHNPPSRQYFACAPVLGALAQNPIEAAAAGLVGSGLHYDLAIPEDILSSAPLLTHDAVHFGVSYVFFAACTGTLVPATGPTENGFPFECQDEQGAPIGPSGFVIGFSTIYSYEGEVNTNPVLTGLSLGGEPAPAFSTDGFGDAESGSSAKACTTDEDCGGDTEHPRACSAHGTCALVFDACENDDCPVLRLLPEFDASNLEAFTGGNEIVWASYYSTLGSFASPTRLVVDRDNGLARDIADGWKPPPRAKDGSPLTTRLWVTLNDQRGGATWAFFDVIVR